MEEEEAYCLGAKSDEDVIMIEVDPLALVERYRELHVTNILKEELQNYIYSY